MLLFYRMRGEAMTDAEGLIRVIREVGTKKSGLKTATLISASNPVSQVLW